MTDDDIVGDVKLGFADADGVATGEVIAEIGGTRGRAARKVIHSPLGK